MTFRRIIAVALVTTAFLNSAFGEGPNPAYKHLKQLEWLVGEWKGEFVVPEGATDGPPPGTKVTSVVSCDWISNKAYLRYDVADTMANGDTGGSREIITWNAIDGRMEHTFSTKDGFVGAGPWSRDGKLQIISWKALGPNKISYEGKGYYENVDADTHTWQLKDLKRNGEPLPEWPKVTYKRIRKENPAKREAIPKKIMNEFEYLVGEWKAEGTSDGSRCVGKWIARMAKGADGAPCGLHGSFEYKVDGEVVDTGENLVGWDAGRKCIVDVGSSTNGEMETFYWTPKNEELWTGEYVRMVDGKEVSGNLALVKKGPSECVFESSGEGRPETRLVFRKVTREKNTPRKKDAKLTASYEDFMEWGNRLEGRWVGKVTLIADWPGINKKRGEVVKGHSLYGWTTDKRALQATHICENSESRELHYWDPAAKQIKFTNVGSAGTVWHVTVGRDGDRWPWTAEGLLPDKTELSGHGDHMLTEGGRFTIKGECLAGEEVLDPLHDVYEKVSE